MILRVVNGRVPEGQLAAVRAALERDYVPAARRQAGLDRYLIATRADGAGHEIALMTVWTDVESALAAYGGDLAAVRRSTDSTTARFSRASTTTRSGPRTSAAATGCRGICD